MTKLNLCVIAFAFAVCATGVNARADNSIPGHPRVNEVDQRLENQQDRVSAGAAGGQLSANQVAHDDARDTKVSQELSADEAKDGGHVTKGEQRQMNRQLNRDSTKIYDQRH